jgi:AraC-like DNA-binding protein
MDTNQLRHYKFISVVYTRLIAKLIHCEGEDLSPFLKGTSLTAQQIYSELQFIPLSEQYIIFNNILNQFPTPGLGIEAGNHAELSIHGLPGVTILAAGTLLNGLQNMVKFYALRAPFINIDLIEDENSITLKGKCIDEVNPQVNRLLVECTFSMIHRICEQMTGQHLSCANINFAYPKPDNTENYSQHLNCTFAFTNQDYSTYTIPLAVAQTPSLTSDPQLQQKAIEVCLADIDKLLRNSSTASRVRDSLTLSDGQFQNLPEMANQLCISPRQLIRQLSKEETSFREILDAEQQRLSLHYLEDDSISIEAIASSLGYSQASNYRRAFKRWYGVTPSEYRKRLQNSRQ